VAGADIGGEGSYDIADTGAGETVRAAAEETQRTARSSAQKAKRTTARQARRVPGAAQAEGAAKGAVASESDLPIAGYDSLTAEQIAKRLPGLSQVDLTQVEVYERGTHDRTTVLDRIGSLRGDEPWAGYDEMTAGQIIERLRDADAELTAKARDHERAHKRRATVLRAAERELANA